MGESKIPIHAYVDESGNTGKNIFDKDQPDYYTAALVTKGDFDLQYSERVKAIAVKVGATAIHANELVHRTNRLIHKKVPAALAIARVRAASGDARLHLPSDSVH